MNTPPSLSCCGFVNKVNGQRCRKRGRYECDVDGNQLVLCGTHRNVQHSVEDCPICFLVLRDSKRLKLSCGHVFHINCLSKCVKRECPLCRTRISPADCCVVYKDTIIDPLTRMIFNLSEESQQRIVTGITHLTHLTKKNEVMGHNLCVVCERFNKTNMSTEHMQTILQLLDFMVHHVEVTGVLPVTMLSSV